MTDVLLAAALALNVLVFLALGADKHFAARGRRRIPERTLLCLALPLAAPGAWLGMSVFRHKTRKRSFRWKMVGVTVLQLALLVLGLRLAGRA